MIKFQEQHQSRLSYVPTNDLFQLSEGPRFLGCLRELDHIQAPEGAFSAATTDSNGLEDAMLNRSISTFLIGISFLPSAAKLALVLRLGATLARSHHGQKIPLPSPNCCRRMPECDP
jgi:hypothetical protein